MEPSFQPQIKSGGMQTQSPAEQRSSAIIVVFVREAKQGDEQALKMLLDLLKPAIEGQVRRMVGSSDTRIKDLAWDALTDAATHLTQCRGETAREVYAWFLKVTKNVVLQAARRSGQLGSRPDSAAYPSVTSAPFERPPAGLQAAIVSALAEAHAELDEPSARLLYSRIVEQLSWSELGESIGCGPEGARKRYERLKDALKDEIIARVLTDKFAGDEARRWESYLRG